MAVQNFCRTGGEERQDGREDILRKHLKLVAARLRIRSTPSPSIDEDLLPTGETNIRVHITTRGTRSLRLEPTNHFSMDDRGPTVCDDTGHPRPRQRREPGPLPPSLKPTGSSFRPNAAGWKGEAANHFQ
ncbi:hypothetical protein CLAIMM_02026 isoform 1 [Cladophialophora immunda]|nr:hypothetical protein CLAIMM_02026 isoform 1 [Cladophialophora immunda]